jgi:hypothetical protein
VPAHRNRRSRHHHHADLIAAVAPGTACLDRFPGISDTVRALRYSSARVVRHLAAGAGMRQLLDIAAGLLFLDPVHEVAWPAGPGSQLVYAGIDPLVLAHARALLTGPDGAVGYASGDLTDPSPLPAVPAAAGPAPQRPGGRRPGRGAGLPVAPGAESVPASRVARLGWRRPQAVLAVIPAPAQPAAAPA